MNLIPADPTLSGKPRSKQPGKQPAKAPAAATSGANAGDSTVSTIASSAPAPVQPVISSSPLATPTLTAGVMYSASFSVRCVTEATPAVRVGVARGDEEITGGTGAGAEEAMVEAVLSPALAPDVAAAGALAGCFAGCLDRGLPLSVGSAGIKFIRVRSVAMRVSM